MSIRTRLLLILGGLAAGYLVLLLTLQVAAGRTHARTDRVSCALFPSSRALKGAESAFSRVRKDYQDAVLLEDATAIQDAQRESSEVHSELAEIRSTLQALPELSARADSLDTRYAALAARNQATYPALLSSKLNVSDSLQREAGSLGRDNQAFSEDLAAFDTALAQASRNEFAAVDLTSRRVQVFGWIVLMLAMLGCAFGWWVLQFRILEPLAALARRMQEIAAGDGDLSVRVATPGHSEIDAVGRGFNTFVARIEGIVARVVESSAAVGQAAASLTSIARETASQSTLQQEHAERISSSLTEISTAIREISHATENAAADARQAERNAHTGGQTLESTLTLIQDALVANHTTATRLEELNKTTEAIGKITQLIDEIADQTNLLALNASIEAARAGEHGRGFGVVATEVRRLAERTTRATREIDHTVRAIQAGTAEAVAAMRSSMEHVESGVSSAQSAGQALGSIIHGSESLQVTVTQIATASNEQTHATAAVTQGLNEIVRLGENTLSTSANAVQACDRLTHLSASLNQLVAAFRISRPAQAGGF